MNNNDQNVDRIQPEANKVKPSRAERKAAKKAKRAAKRRAQRAAYDEAGFFGRIWFIFKKIIKTILNLLLLTVIGIGIYVGGVVFSNTATLDLLNDDSPATEEEILAFSPSDVERASAIDAMKQYSPDDTWSIYLYDCGADLESSGISELSDVVYWMTRDYKNYNHDIQSEKYAMMVKEFLGELHENGMDLPEYMYLPWTGQSKGIVSAQRLNPLVELIGLLSESDNENAKQASASTDLKEMFSVALPENVQIIVQTGGAKSWDNNMINPNRAQRFVYNSEGFNQVDEQPICNMGSKDTLEDFLSFCKKGYSADHQMLMFWNHGGGPFGFCVDEIFGTRLSLADARQALENVYGHTVKPPFEVIGFDACLMATAEVAKTLEGYGKYLVASEETEPGSGWAHDVWLSALAENPGINGAQLGKAVVDGFIAENAKDDKVSRNFYNVGNAVTLSVVDIAKAAKAYDAYEEFAGKLLKDSFDNPYVLSAIGKAAANSVRYGNGDAFNVFNTVDMALLMDNLGEFYPVDAAVVSKAVRDSVLYSRASCYEKESQGLALYVPVSIDSYKGLSYYLDYINNICLSPNIKALYYYKFAGCLNDELSEYVEEQGYGSAPTVNNAPLKEIASLPVNIEEDGNVSIQLSKDETRLIQNAAVEIAKYDTENQTVLYYGRDVLCGIDDTDLLFTEFEGKWASIDGNILHLEPINADPSSDKYRIRAMVNDADSYIVLSYNRETMSYSVIGVSPASTEEMPNTAHRNIQNLKPGDKISIIYETNSVAQDKSKATSLQSGISFIYNDNSVIADAALPNGEYLLTIVVTDARGDEFYSPVVGLTMRDEKIEETKLRAEFYGIRS